MKRTDFGAWQGSRMQSCSDPERDPENWMPVFRQNRAQTKGHKRDDDLKKSHSARASRQGHFADTCLSRAFDARVIKQSGAGAAPVCYENVTQSTGIVGTPSYAGLLQRSIP